MNVKPNFLIIGAAKAGTTSLHQILGKHPDIFLPEEKDFKFFDRDENYSRGMDWYANYFRNYGGQSSIGEANSEYLFNERAARRIKEHLGAEVKLIAILRHPADRSYSEYLHQKRYEQVDREFNHYLNPGIDSNDNTGNKLYDVIVGRSFYSRHLKKYLESFSNSQIKVVILERLKNNPTEEINKLYKFLGVAEQDNITLLRANKAYTPKYSWLNRLVIQPNPVRRVFKKVIPSFALRRRIRGSLKKVNAAESGSGLGLDARTREQLMKGIFKSEQSRLEQLLEMKIPEWDTPS